MILIIDTSDETARFGLFSRKKQVDSLEWKAYRELSKTFYEKLNDLFVKNNLKYEDIEGVIIIRGPGSFTGLRIGIAIANALSYSLDIPISGVIQKELLSLEETFKKGFKGLKKNQIITPFYGREPNITIKKK